MYLRLPIAAGLLALALAACDGNGAQHVVSDAPGLDGATCLVGTPDCDDTDAGAPADDPDDPQVDEGAVIREAEGLLGVSQDELDPKVRVSRAGDEQFALTEDYVIGRITVELDPDDEGVLRVVSATVELTEAPLTVTA